MDIIETGELGVRSAVLRLRRRGSPLRFTIYPMIHIAEEQFYTEVSRRLRDHDLIVTEGVGYTISSRLLTSGYRLAANRARLGLAVQPDSLTDVGVEVIVADMTGEEFAAGWRRVPPVERLLVGTFAPLHGLYLRAFGTREALARYLRTNDETTFDDLDIDSGLTGLVGKRRDAIMIRILDQIHRERHTAPIDVAIVFGAYHAIPAVTYLMAAHGYVVADAEWLTVFDY